MLARFSLFNSATDLAQSYWKSLLQEGDHVIDATLGNGYDTLFLAKIVLTGGKGAIFGFDIQEQALINTWKQLASKLDEDSLKRVVLFHESHDQMKRLVKEPVKLIVYNLGYLPKGNKALTTIAASTLESISQGLNMLVEGGVLSVVCYPGHAEGEREEKAILEFVRSLPPSLWSVSYSQFVNRINAPSLLLVQKSVK